ncbi:MAG: long-chain fatty acid--CoA ligase [Myxococcales bacterium]
MSDRHLTSWPPKVSPKLTLPETSVWFNLEVSATRYPNKPAIIFYDSTLSYAELKRDAEHLAGYLQQACGVKRGDRVGLWLQNSPQFVVAYYAILRADAVVVPMNPMNLTAELRYLLADSGARVLIAAQELFEQARPLLGDPLEHTVVVTYSDYLRAPSELNVPELVSAPRADLRGPGVVPWSEALSQKVSPGAHSAGPDDLCVLPYTSGTTGHPKGCMHSHRTVMHTVMAGPHWQRTFHEECTLSVLPFFHVTGMQNSMNSPIYSGASMVILPRWDREVAAALIERYRVTGWTSVPTMVVDLLSSPAVARFDLSSLRQVGGGGAAMPEAIASKLQEQFGLNYLEGYGLSETAAATHINPVQHPKKQCLGIPIFGVDSRVVDPQTLRELPAGEIGEIITHGPQVFLGYWNRPEANAECFVELDGKRFFRTGDLARTDDEGFFFLVDRLKRMINASGFKVWPAEVEAQLYAHPDIQEATVIAQRHPRRGETVKAVIVLKPAQRGSRTEQDIIEWARGQMAAYKVPRSVEFVESLPKTGSGKIQWRLLQEQEDARMREAAPELTSP